MQLKESHEVLTETGIPVAYRHCEGKDSPGLPILVYMEAYSNNFAADGIVYEKIRHMQVDLYTASKEPETEDRVENALSGFFWEKDEEYLQNERCCRVTYEVEV